MAGNAPHIVRTALQHRQQTILSACVSSIQRLSPTVKGFTLKVDSTQECYFKAGQWLDLFVPGISHVGGFSMWSPPHEFSENGTLRLAIKKSEDPVANWAHEKCTIGDQVQFRFGGNFFYDPALDEDNHSLCLIAGGVGMNPLMSILLETAHHDDQRSIRRKVLLLQTASMTEELLYMQETASLLKSNLTFSRLLFVTGPENTNSEVIRRRLNQDDIKSAIEKCNEKTKYFVCGPAAMIDEIVNMLRKLGKSEEVYFEKWS